MRARCDYVAEIQEIRDRSEPLGHDTGIVNMLILSTQADHLKGGGAELGYFPVAAIAAVQSYFRAEIARLIDCGDARFINNIAVDELPLRIRPKLLVALHGRRVSVGELVAHVSRLSSLDAIGKTMTQLLGSDFLALVKDARDPWERRDLGDKALLVIQSADEAFGDVRRTFELRNMICHEAYLKQVVQSHEIKRICSSCYSFLRASYYAVQHYRDPRPPLTLEESIQVASERLQSLESEIRSVEERISTRLPPWLQKSFAEMQESWRHFVERESYFDCSQEMNMGRGALRQKQWIADASQTRLETLKRFADKLEEGSGQHSTPDLNPVDS